MKSDSKKSRLIIIGASGHGKVVADIAKLNHFQDIVFLDDDETIKECAGFPILGRSDSADKYEGLVFVAVGNAKLRKKLMSQYCHREFPVLIHPQAVIARDVGIDSGTVVMAGAVINPEVTIGCGCIINTSSSIDHNCDVGNFVHIAVGSHLCGTVTVGENVWIGAGSTISNNLSICADCTIGAGAVVVKDIKEIGTYIGVPAKKMKL